MSDGRRICRWILPGLLLLNAALKFSWLGAHGLIGDEPFTVYWAQRPLAELFGMLRTENNPPLYFLLMHAWSALGPLDEAWLRIPSALFSVLTVWPFYSLAGRIGGPRVALVAALLFTFGQHPFGFAHEVRAYALLVLACTWSVLQLVRAADPERARSAMPWLIVANILLVWTHFFGWLMIGLEVLFVLAIPELKVARKALLRSAGIAVLTCIPYAFILFQRASSSVAQGTWLEAPGWEEPYNMLVRWSNAPVVTVCFLALAAIAFARGHERRMRLAWLWCGVPLVGMFLLSFVVPMYADRYLLFASMGWYLLVAQATASLPSMPWRTGASIAAVVAMAATFTPWRAPASDPGRVVQQVDAWREGRTQVIIQPCWYGITYAWYADRALYRRPEPIEEALRSTGVTLVCGPEGFMPDSTCNTWIIVDAWAALTDPEGRVEQAVRECRDPAGEAVPDPKVHVRRYRR